MSLRLKGNADILSKAFAKSLKSAKTLECYLIIIKRMRAKTALQKL